MRAADSVAAIAAVAIACLAVSAPAAAQPPRLLVSFEPDTSAQVRQQVFASGHLTPVTYLPQIGTALVRANDGVSYARARVMGHGAVRAVEDDTRIRPVDVISDPLAPLQWHLAQT